MQDVDDVEAFVKSCIRKSGLRIEDRSQYEELACEALVILCELNNRYDPTKEKNPAKASFAGYAWFLLPRKILDAWHKMNPNHVSKTFTEQGEDGQPITTRKWVYYEPACSLDERIERFEDPDEFDISSYRQCGDYIPLPIPTGAGE
jgi:hypothetical protein